MSSMIKCAKLRPSERPHIKPSVRMETQGAPFLSLRMNIFGTWPSAAIATGRRLYDITSELNELNSASVAVDTRITPSHGPATVAAIVAQLPVSHTSGGICAYHAAPSGIKYERKIASSANIITRG